MGDPTWNGVLLASAAVFAAAVAAWTANRRIDKQLDAESERLDHQLQHDREMRDLDELRGILDESALAMHQTVDAHIALESVGMSQGTQLSQPTFLAAAEEIRQEALDDFNTLNRKLWELMMRLHVRLWTTDPIIEALDQFIVETDIYRCSVAEITDERWKHFSEGRSRMAAAQAKFATASFPVAGTRHSIDALARERLRERLIHSAAAGTGH